MTITGIIGGSGMNNSDMLENPQKKEVITPYGKPSSPLTFGQIKGRDVVVIARHGDKHQTTPSNVNNRANISALKEHGVTSIIATTACGSLREEIKKGDFVIIDQFIDFTRLRKSTFFDSFENGIEHTSMADPFDADMRKMLFNTAKKLEIAVHKKGTVVTIEGPRFSTRAESKMFRLLGGDVINMSIAPEVILANEAKIPYAAIAMSTDYDCWKEDEPEVKWEDVMVIFNKNVEHVINLIKNVIKEL